MIFLNLNNFKENNFNYLYKSRFNFFRVIKVIISRVYLRILSKDLNVPSWHLNATYYARKYKSKVIKIYQIFSTNIDHVIEVGCGTGDLISRINNSNKLGIDVDKNVLHLCNKLNPNLKTICSDVIDDFDVLKNYISNLNNNSTIFIVMVNWLHIYPINKANSLIKNLLSINQNIILLVDIYSRPENSNRTDNKTKHFFDELKEVKWLLEINDIDSVRDFKLISNFNPSINYKNLN